MLKAGDAEVEVCRAGGGAPEDPRYSGGQQARQRRGHQGPRRSQGTGEVCIPL